MSSRPSFSLLSVVANIERHKLSSGEPWLLLLDLEYPGDGLPTIPGTVVAQTHIRFVRDLDPFTFDADDGHGPQIYEPFNFSMGDLAVGNNGQVPDVELQASNVLRVLQGIIDQYAGVVGANLYLYVVNTTNPAGEPDLALAFTVKKTASDAKLVKFTLGASSPLRRLFPIHLYRPNFCGWQYKSEQCGYTGTDLTGQTIDGSQFVFNLSSVVGLAVTNTLAGSGIPAGATVLAYYGYTLPMLCAATSGSAVYTLLGTTGSLDGVTLGLTPSQVASILRVGLIVDLPGGGLGSHPTILSVDTGANTMTLSAPASSTSSSFAVSVEMRILAMSAPATATATDVDLTTSFVTCSHNIDGTTGCSAHFPGVPLRGLFFPGIDTNGAAVASVA